MDTETRPSRDQHQIDRIAAERLLGEALVDLPHSPHNPLDLREKRIEQMRALYHEHRWSLANIGSAYGMSREAVRWLFDAFGVARRPQNGAERYRRTIEARRERRRIA